MYNSPGDKPVETQLEFNPPEKKDKDEKTYWVIPLAKLGKNESIFDEKYKLWKNTVMNKFLQEPVYFRNEIITCGINGTAQEAKAGAKITMELLAALDKVKANFKVRKTQVSDQELQDGLANSMGEIMVEKEKFFIELQNVNPVEIQTTVKDYIESALSSEKIELFAQHYKEINNRLNVASEIITTSDRFLGTAVAIKKIIETEKAQLGLDTNKIGETTEHLVKTAWLALALAEELNDFGAEDYKILALSMLSHDDGKALMPKEILYKKGRLTAIESEIMKTHIYLGFVMSTANQTNISKESIIKALHHQKEDPKLPSSYSISKSAATSFYDYLTPEAKLKLDENETQAIKFARLMNIVDAFEAITAERKYKRGSSIGKALSILENDNKRAKHFYQPYLNAFIRMIIKTAVPECADFIKIDDSFVISDYIITNYIKGELSEQQKEALKNGFIIRVLKNADENNEIGCGIENNKTKKIARTFNIKAIDVFKETSMTILDDMCLAKDFYGYKSREH